MANENESIAVPYDEHDEDGKFRRSYHAEDMLDAVENAGGSASTGEVADDVGCSRRLALLRLRELEDDGKVSAREVGNTFLWTLQTENNGESN